MNIYIYIYMYIHTTRPHWRRPPVGIAGVYTPALHSKIPAHKIFARVWLAQEPICS